MYARPRPVFSVRCKTWIEGNSDANCLFLAAVLLLSLAGRTQAASSAEQRAFATATNALRDGFYDQAEKFFREFIQQYSGSSNLVEAFLLQGQAQIEQTNYAGAIEL